MKTEQDEQEEPKKTAKAKVAKENEGDAEHPDSKDVEEAGEDGDGEEGVTVPEEFQQKAHELVSKADKHHISHLRDKINAREDELRAEKAKSESKDKNGKGLSFSSEGMPSSDNDY